MSNALVERGQQVMDEFALNCAPFTYQAYLVFNEPDLLALKSYLETLILHDGAGWETFKDLDRNFDLLHLKNAAGNRALSIIYMPVFKFQQLGTNFLAVYRRIALHISEIVFSAADLAGYGLDKSRDMFNHLVGNLASGALVMIGRYIGGNVCATSDEARFLDQNLTREQWYYVDRLTPTALSTVAREHFMTVTNGQAYIDSNGNWFAKTYFHDKQPG